MYTFKTIIDDFECPLNTTLEDSIHMPQNHNNRNRRRPRRYAEHKHENNAGVVQATGVVPPEQRRVAPTLMTGGGEGDASGSGGGCPEVTYSQIPNEGSRRNRPTATLDARVRGEEGGEQRNFTDAEHHETRQQGSAGPAPSGEKSRLNTTPPHSPTRVIFGKLPRRPEYKTRVSSPIFDEIMKLRAEVQDKILGDTGNGNKDVAQDKGMAPRLEAPLVKEVAEVEEPARSKTPEFIPGVEVSEENWAQPLYELATRERPSKRASGELDPIDALSNAMEELRVFQEIGSSSGGDRVKIVATPVMNLDLTPESSGAQKAEVVRGNGDGESKEAEAQKKKAEKSIPPVPSKESVKSLSLESMSSDDFEKVDKPAAAESEENGGRRKWYKGFRR